MADKKISELTPTTSAGSTDEIPLVQSATNKKIAVGNLPVSTATQTALDAKADLSSGKLSVAQLPFVGLNAWCAGKPANSEVVGGGKAPFAFTISASDSTLECDDAATASTVFTLKGGAAGTTTIGTWTLSASGTTATLSISGSSSVALGDRLRIIAPSSADATAGNLNFVVRRA